MAHDLALTILEKAKEMDAPKYISTNLTINIIGIIENLPQEELDNEDDESLSVRYGDNEDVVVRELKYEVYKNKKEYFIKLPNDEIDVYLHFNEDTYNYIETQLKFGLCKTMEAIITYKKKNVEIRVLKNYLNTNICNLYNQISNVFRLIKQINVSV